MTSSNDVINPPKMVMLEIRILANYVNVNESILVNASFYIDAYPILY